jgi:hypothetical protein
MKKTTFLFLTYFYIVSAFSQSTEMDYFEMRTYHAHEGKRPDLIKRFKDHTLHLFEKNGIENFAYFIPTNEEDNTLTFILGYPDKASRDVMWNKFANSPEWQEVYKASEANGPLVAKVDQVFLEPAKELNPDVSRVNPNKKKIFELRTYTMHPGKVEAINARFRDYTRELFQKHDMTNVKYWYTVPTDGSQPKLVYLLGHKNEKAAKSSFADFVKDPAWIVVRDASERDGKIVEKVDSNYLKALEFSPLR